MPERNTRDTLTAPADARLAAVTRERDAHRRLAGYLRGEWTADLAMRFCPPADHDHDRCVALAVVRVSAAVRGYFEAFGLDGACPERPKPTAVVLVERVAGDGWDARLKHDRARWDHGRTPAQALGEFLKTHGDAVGVRVEYPGETGGAP